MGDWGNWERALFIACFVAGRAESEGRWPRNSRGEGAAARARPRPPSLLLSFSKYHREELKWMESRWGRETVLVLVLAFGLSILRLAPENGSRDVLLLFYCNFMT